MQVLLPELPEHSGPLRVGPLASDHVDDAACRETGVGGDEVENASFSLDGCEPVQVERSDRQLTQEAGDAG